MGKSEIVLGLTIALFGMSTGSTIAEEKGSSKPKAEKPKQEPEKSEKEGGKNNPFKTSQRIKEEAKRLERKQPEFQPIDLGKRVPKLTLHGFARVGKGQPVALLGVKGEDIFLIRVGDEISLQIAGRNTVLKVKKLTRLSASIEIGTLGQLIVVR